MAKDRRSSKSCESDPSMAKVSKWSELVPDIIRSVLEGLNFKDFHGARTVCSTWYSASKSCILTQTPFPWLIIFPYVLEPTDDYFCLLVSPLTHHLKKPYRISGLGIDFARSRCLATSGNWFLMIDHRSNLYIFNLFTRKRIDLPAVETLQEGQMSFERRGKNEFILTLRSVPNGIEVSSPVIGVKTDRAVLWVDERTEDYLVVWMVDCFMAFCKRGDTKWREVPTLGPCLDMALKDINTLYVLTSRSRRIRIVDFSGDGPKEAGESIGYPPFHPNPNTTCGVWTASIVFTVSGDVMILVIWERLKKQFTDMYKMNPEATKWEKVEYLDGEAVIEDLGVMLPATDCGLVKENSIYLSNTRFWRRNQLLHPHAHIRVIDLKTKNPTPRWRRRCCHKWRHGKSVLLFLFWPRCKDARWFLPRFGGR